MHDKKRKRSTEVIMTRASRAGEEDVNRSVIKIRASLHDKKRKGSAVVIMIRASFQDRTGRVNSGYREVESYESTQPKDKILTNLLENIPQK